MILVEFEDEETAKRMFVDVTAFCWERRSRMTRNKIYVASYGDLSVDNIAGSLSVKGFTVETTYYKGDY
jgi:hypothetical protein